VLSLTTDRRSPVPAEQAGPRTPLHRTAARSTRNAHRSRSFAALSPTVRDPRPSPLVSSAGLNRFSSRLSETCLRPSSHLAAKSLARRRVGRPSSGSPTQTARTRRPRERVRRLAGRNSSSEPGCRRIIRRLFTSQLLRPSRAHLRMASEARRPVAPGARTQGLRDRRSTASAPPPDPSGVRARRRYRAHELCQVLSAVPLMLTGRVCDSPATLPRSGRILSSPTPEALLRRRP
jgi:hypothetical protein